MQTFQRFQQHPKKKQLVWGIGGVICLVLVGAVLWQTFPMGVDDAETGTLTDDEVLAEFEASLKSGKSRSPLPTAASLQGEPPVEERHNLDLTTAPDKLPIPRAELYGNRSKKRSEEDWLLSAQVPPDLQREVGNETVIRPDRGNGMELPASPPTNFNAPSFNPGQPPVQQQTTGYSPNGFNPQQFNRTPPPANPSQVVSTDFGPQNDPNASAQTMSPQSQGAIQQVSNEMVISPGYSQVSQTPGSQFPGAQQPLPQQQVAPNPNLQGPVSSIPTTPGPQPGIQPAQNQSAILEVDQQLERIEGMIQQGDYVSAHRDLSKIYWTKPELRDLIDPMIDLTSRKIFFDPQPNFLRPYEVQPGDNLGSIAKQYNVPWEYLQKLNRISDPTKIQVGQQLKVNRGPFNAVVDLNRFEVTVHAHNYFVRRYKIGIGRDQQTPVGEFLVLDKVSNPQYTSPEGKVVSGTDPSNPLGTRWLALGQGNVRTSYGIHGTIDPRSIGKAESAGCVRMHNSDVEVVFDLLDFGSQVIIRP